MPNSTTMAGRRIFISYARDDGPRVEKDAALLRAGGARVFIDVQDIEAGSPWEPALESALAKCERVMVFWSRAAKGSTWVDREWRTALRLGKRVIPALLDDTPLPRELAALQGISRSSDSVGVANRMPKLLGAAWLGAAVVAAAVVWATLRVHDEAPGPLPAVVDLAAPARSASDAAVAAAAVDSVRDQALLLRLRINRAADNEASANSLREGREKLAAAIRNLPIDRMATPDLVRLHAETEALRAALDARGSQFPDDSATGQEFRSLKGFLTSATISDPTSAPPYPQDDRSFKLSVLAVLATLIIAYPLVHVWHKRRRARAFVEAVLSV